jgi:sulfur carrier protein ThiS
VIFTEQENVNPITRKTSYDRIPVVGGTVSGIVTANEAWIVPEDEAKARRVRLGDQIEVVHKDSPRGNLFLP